MRTGRLEAFSDGVLAIIITIMVLELRVPHGAATWAALRPVVPVLLSYALSFVYVGIYWNNHHHTFQATGRVTGGVLWANLHLLFWLSLVPFATAWMGENGYAAAPTALYGGVLLMSGFAFTLLQRAILRVPGGNAVLARAVGGDRKAKGSLALYGLGIGLSFVVPRLGCAVYVVVALLWLIPDPRIERAVAGATPGDEL